MREGQDVRLRENKASIFTHDNVTAEGNGHLGLSLYRDLTMTSNFTWEAFVKLPTNALVGANGGQFFSTEIPKAYVTEQYNSKGFYVCQNSKISTNHWDSTIRGKAHIIFCATCWTNAANTGVGNNDQRFEFGVDLDKWTHLAFTYDAATRTFTAYKNYQVAKNSYQTCRTVFSEDKAPAFNYDADGNFVMRLFNAALNRNSGFEGSLDELRISTRVLTPDEFLKPRTGLGLSVIVR